MVEGPGAAVIHFPYPNNHRARNPCGRVYTMSFCPDHLPAAATILVICSELGRNLAVG